MPTKNETERINITISDTMIKEENEKEIKTRVPYTYDDNVRYLVLNQDDVKRIHDGKTLFASLEKDKIYNLLGESGKVVEQIRGEKLFKEHYDPAHQKNKNADKRKSVSEEKTSSSEEKNDKAVSQSSSEKSSSEPEKNIKLKHSTLDSKHTKIEIKKAKFEDKNKKLQEKINKAKSKIERWQAKKDDAQEALKHCKKLLDIPALPAPVVQFLKMYAESKENKIGSLNNKIGIKRDKIDIRQDKITKNNQRISRLDKKLDKLERIDKFLNNMHSSQGRRENFVDSLQQFRKSSLARSRSKLLKLDKKISETQKAFERTHSAEDKVKLRNALHTYSEQRKVLEEKITKLEVMSQKLEAVNLLPDKRADEIINESCEKVSSAINNKADITPNQAVDEVLDVSEQTIDNKFAEMKEEPSQNVEDRLKEAIAYDTMFYGVLTDQTVNSIKQAGYTYDNGMLESAVTEKEVKEQENVSAEQSEKSSEDTHEKKSSPLTRNAIKKSAAAIKAKEADNEAPKKVKSKGQEL